MKTWIFGIMLTGLLSIPGVINAQSGATIGQNPVPGGRGSEGVSTSPGNQPTNSEQPKTLFPDQSNLGGTPFIIPRPARLSPPVVSAPTPAPTLQAPSTVKPERGIIDPRTGDFYPGVFGGAINPKTGDFLPKTGGGFINPRTGEFFPAK